MSKLLLQEHPLIVQPTLAKLLGLNEALFVQQLHYWLNPKVNRNIINGQHWVYNTYAEWREQFPFWSVKTLRRIVLNLEEAGIVSSILKVSGFQKKKFYTLDYDKLNQICNNNNQCDTSDENVSIQDISENSQDNLTSGHFDHIDLPKRAAIGAKTPEKPTPPSAQTGTPCGQSDQMEVVKMTRLHIKDTETTTDILPPPTSSNHSNGTKDEDDENQNIANFSQPNAASAESFSSQHSSEGLHNHTPNNSTSPQPAALDADAASPFPKKALAQELVAVWNRVVQPSLSHHHVILTSQRETAILVLFKTIFNNSADQWESYCNSIASNGFLMGKSESGFKAQFDWAIKPDNAAKILEGVIYDSTGKSQNQTPKNWAEFESSLRHDLQEKHDSKWINTCLDIAKDVGIETYLSWFTRIVPWGIQDDVLILKIPSQFFCDKLNKDYFTPIQAAVSKNYNTQNVNLELLKTSSLHTHQPSRTITGEACV